MVVFPIPPHPTIPTMLGFQLRRCNDTFISRSSTFSSRAFGYLDTFVSRSFIFSTRPVGYLAGVKLRSAIGSRRKKKEDPKTLHTDWECALNLNIFV
jgi:hypothetical protein